jgi:Arc/MetJ-type ribon-helix-helix transcriptional regulator
MSIKLPPDIAALVKARVGSGEFASAEEVVRSAMAPWIERERLRAVALAKVRSKISDGDADETNLTASAVRQHLDDVAAALQRHEPDAA